VLLAVSLVACFDARRIVFVSDGADAGGVEAMSSLLTPGPASGVTGSEAAAAAPGAVDTAGAAARASAAAGVLTPASLDAGGLAPAPPATRCSFPSTFEPDAVLFSGAVTADTCRLNLDAPYETFWYPFQDTAAASSVEQGAAAPGCEPNNCSLRVRGPAPGSEGYRVSGAGVGFPLALTDTPLDITRFAGIQFWARGTAVGTRGPDNTNAPQTLFVKVGTSTARLGDDFGAYCAIEPSTWTLCRSDFASLRRDGYVAEPDLASDVLDLGNATRVEFEFRLYRDALGNAPAPVSFDAELASISFF
jgi:hypothetical protein